MRPSNLSIVEMYEILETVLELLFVFLISMLIGLSAATIIVVFIVIEMMAVKYKVESLDMSAVNLILNGMIDPENREVMKLSIVGIGILSIAISSCLIYAYYR